MSEKCYTPHFNDMVTARGGKGAQGTQEAAKAGKGQPPAVIDKPKTGNVAKPRGK